MVSRSRQLVCSVFLRVRSSFDDLNRFMWGRDGRELTPAVTVLQLFLSSSKPVLRFAAVRTLNRVAMTHPMAVTNCNIDMESLISDANRSIATLAITTLLKTGAAALPPCPHLVLALPRVLCTFIMCALGHRQAGNTTN